MRVLLLGASGRAGGEVLGCLLLSGADVTSFGRTAPKRPGARHVAGAIDDADALAAAMDGRDAVLSCLASTNSEPVCSRAAAAVIAAAGGRPVRFLSIGGAGVDAPGDRKGVPDRLVGLIMRVPVGRMLADRQAELAMLERSALDWTMLRPPRLTEGAPKGAWAFSFERPPSFAIDRADLAGAMVEAIGRPDLRRRAPFVAAPKGSA